MNDNSNPSCDSSLTRTIPVYTNIKAQISHLFNRLFQNGDPFAPGYRINSYTLCCPDTVLSAGFYYCDEINLNKTANEYHKERKCYILLQ